MKYFVAILVCFWLAACDRPHQVAAKNQPSWLKMCPDFSVTGKAPVEANAQCGQFQVRENPGDSSSKMISLNLLRLPAINPVPDEDPLFVVAGGPGQSAVTLAEAFHGVFREVRKNRDIIFVDQRGTGKSNPFDCEFESDGSKDLPANQQEDFQRKAVTSCIEKYRDQFEYYTTPYAVADLDAVRAELGYQKINLWGGSYGSRVVLHYIREFEPHARAAIIDGAAPVSIALPWFMEADGSAALEAISHQCAQTPECVAAYGDIKAKADSVSAKLSVKPVEIVFPHPRTQGKISMLLNAQDFAGVVHLSLYSRDLSALLPKMISDADAGDYQLFASLMYLAKSKSELMNINYGMHYAVVCNEDYQLYKDKSPQESELFLRSAMVQKYKEVCSQWPPAKKPLSPEYFEPVSSQVPLLVLSGAVDPVTPPHWGELVASKMPNAVHLVAAGGHHIVTQEGCISQLVALFIAQGNGKNLDAECVQNIQPLALVVPPGQIKPATAGE